MKESTITVKTTIDEVIVNYIKKYNVVNISMTYNDKPWSANCFYSFDEEKAYLMFLSHDTTEHYKVLQLNPNISGTITTQTENVAHIQGIQFTGRYIKLNKQMEKEARSCFISKFPFARFMRAPICVVELNYIKYTDNTLGFGKKIIWTK